MNSYVKGHTVLGTMPEKLQSAGRTGFCHCGSVSGSPVEQVNVKKLIHVLKLTDIKYRASCLLGTVTEF